MSGSQRRARRVAASGLVLAGLLGFVFAGPAGGAPGDATASRVADILPGSIGSQPVSLFNAGGTLLFSASDGTNGTELWKSNGGPLGPGGTELIDPLSQGGIASGSEGSTPTEFADVNGTAFFRASDGTVPTFHGAELWKILPPFTTPIQVEDINTNSSSLPTDLTNVNGTLLFQANDGTTGAELWKSAPPYDAGATNLVENINPTANTGSLPHLLTNVNGTLFFEADGGGDDELWKSEPPFNEISTTKVDVNPSGNSFPGPFVNVGGTLLFGADDGSGDGFELFKLAPPYTTPAQVKDINPTAGLGSDLNELVNVNGTVFFRANDGSTPGQHGFELWKSVPPYDSSSTTVLDINPGTESSDPSRLTNIAGILFLGAGDGVHGKELWKSNGGPVGAGTDLVADIRPGDNSSDSSPSQLAEVGGQVFFGADDGSNGRELWKSNGVGATLVADVNTAPATGSVPRELTDVSGTLFFEANDGVSGDELWKATIEPAAPVLPAVPAAPSNAFTAGKLKGKKLQLNVSAAGVVAVDDVGARASGSIAVAAAKNLLKPSIASGGPGTIVVKLRLTKSAQATLNRNAKLKLKAKITFTPTGGTANSQSAKLKIKK